VAPGRVDGTLRAHAVRVAVTRGRPVSTVWGSCGGCGGASGPAGLTPADFVAANEAINAYLRHNPGSCGAAPSRRDDGGIIDSAAYDGHAHAPAGAAGITEEMAASAVYATTDHGAVDWRITTVLVGISRWGCPVT
jgi:hypothetical protein